MTTSNLAPATDPLAPALPAWAVPASPDADLSVVGIDKDGTLYIYGDTPATPGPRVPALSGALIDITTVRLGKNSRFGPRDYLDFYLAAPIPNSRVLLRLPCGLSPNLHTGIPQMPWAVRSLLSALATLDLQETAIKLQTTRGRDNATFFRVIPYTPDGHELPEVRAESIGGGRDDLEIAVNRLLSLLGRPPLFASPHDQ